MSTVAVLTAIFSTAGINVFLYITAAVLSLPKQAALVIVGVALEESGNGKFHADSSFTILTSLCRNRKHKGQNCFGSHCYCYECSYILRNAVHLPEDQRRERVCHL